MLNWSHFRIPTFVSSLILAAAILPAEEKVASNSDIMVIANAQTELVTFTNFFTTIENLDDLGGPTPNNPFDFINDNGGALVISPFTGEIRSNRLDYINRPSGLDWNGPYLSAFINLSGVNRFTDDTHFYDEGHPLDPWFNPYLFYTPLGLVVPRTESITLDFHGDSFNQFAIVSLGPDGVVSGDDVIRFIPGFSGVTGVAISSLRLRTSGSTKVLGEKQSAFAWEILIRGYNFGVSQGNGSVMLNSNPATVLNWSDSEVLIGTNTIADETTVVELTVNGGNSESFTGVVDETPPSSVAHWTVYD